MTQRIVQSPCKDSLLDEVSRELLSQAIECVVTKGEFCLALSESDSLDDLYALLMCDPEMRGMPWDKIQTYFFGESSLEDSIQVAIAAHSGIPEANVHNVLEGMPDGITIDCCVSNGEDLQGLPDEFIRHCASWLIVGTDNMPSLDLGGVAHMYVIN